jgi:NAD dependent epimerase/dehydratase
MDWANKKVLVTGAEGFIGSHLTERLVALGAEVKALVMYNSFNTWGWIDTFRPGEKNKLHIICADIREADLLKSTLKDIDIVFHLAALIAIPYSYASPSSYIKTNIEGTLNLLQAARDHGVEKFLHTSTSEVYGTALYTPIDEKHSLQGQSPYSASKIGADMIAESFHKSFDLPVITVRPFNTYGPRQSLRAIIPTMILQMLNSNKIRLGSLQPIRDFTYVSDTVEGFIKVAETDEIDGEVINIGSANGISIGKLAEKLMKMMNKKITIESEEKRVRPSKSEVNQLICNNNKAKELIDWQPKMSLDEGLEKTINWFKANAGEYKSEIYNI